MNRNTLVLGSVAVLLALLYLFLAFGERDRNSERLSFPQDPEVVRIEGPGDSITLRRSGAEWRLAEIDAPADPETVRELLDPITGEKRLLLAATESAGGYGLSGANSITITMQGGGNEATLTLGTTSASGRQVYLRTGSREKVYLLDRRVREIAEGGAMGLRERVLRRIPEEEILTLTIATPSESQARIYRRRGDSSSSAGEAQTEEMARIARTWAVEGTPLEPYQLENLFQELAALRANGFEEREAQGAADSSEGETPPFAAELTIELRDGSTEQIELVPLRDNRYRIVGPELPEDAVILPWRARRLTVGLLNE